ncbi:serpin family protein [Halobacteriaceae archaeon GCM10025711]
MDRRQLLAASGALAAAALAGCLGQGDPATGSTSTPGTSTEKPPTGTPSVDDERLAELATGNAAFALDLHQHLAAEENLFLSPYSVSVALAMTYAGARGETEAQMRETLRYTLGEDVHPAFADLQAALDARATAEDPVEDETVDAFQLSVANALWGREDYPFAEAFLALLDEFYGAGLRRADFAGDPEGERERINAWVADRTEDRIDDLLPPNALDPSTVLVLTNAIYFMAGWQFEFDPDDTADGTFTGLDGAESAVPMMRQHLRTNYARVAGAEVIELPYVGGEVSMVLMLPDEGAFEAFEAGLDAETLFGVFDALGDASGDLRLPRFEFESEVQLSTVLAEMGMPVAFSPDADFGGMVESGDGPWIDEVYHDSFVSVDEEGTEAAAATAVVMNESAPAASFDVTFDRPFLFCIRDRPTDAVLFLGRVVDAGAAQG